MVKVRLRVGDLVKKRHLNVMESGILIQRHESYWNEDEKRQIPVMWNIFGWTKPKRAIESALKKGIAEGRIIHAPVRNNK